MRQAVLIGVLLAGCSAADEQVANNADEGAIDEVRQIIASSKSRQPEMVDPAAIWHSCDEAAVDTGFAKAGLPQGSLADDMTVVYQAAGPWKGQRVIHMSVDTTSGTAFCTTDQEGKVLAYKFNGREIIAP